MPTLAFGGWTFGVLVPDWLNQSKTLARIFNYNHLGANDAERNSLIAQMMNWTIEEMLEANPKLDLTSADYDLPDAAIFGSNILAIPDDLRGQDITSVDFIDEAQGAQRLAHCFFVDKYGWQQLDPTWRNGTVTTRNPLYCTFDDTAENLLFAPYPNDDTAQVRLTYRARADVIPSDFLGTLLTPTVSTIAGSPNVTGSADLDTDINPGDSVTIDETPYTAFSVSTTALVLTTNAQSTLTGALIYLTRMAGEIPVRFREVPALRLAARLIESTNVPLFQELMGKYQSALTAMQQEITKQLAAWQSRTNLEARPNQVFDTGGLFLHQYC